MNDVFLFLIGLIFVFLILLISYQNYRIKGIIGERQVSGALRRLNSEYIVIDNVKLDIKGSISQIDHIIISRYGIFVLETKNYKGWILGNEHSQNWMQIIYKHKSKFYNPIKQNQGHIYSLQYILKGYRDIKFISIIVFTNKATLKIKTFTPVINLNRLIKTIHHYDEILINESIVQQIAFKIYSSNLNHKQNRKTVYKKVSIQQANCPECNGILVERNGRYGKFFGCSHYPICRFTKN